MATADVGEVAISCYAGWKRRMRAEGMTGERALGWFGATDDWLKAVWNFELFAVEGHHGR